MSKTKIVLIIILVLSNWLMAQELETRQFKLSGNLNADSKLVFDSFKNIEPAAQLSGEQLNKKSPALAGVMSAVIPGSGELYVGDYLKAAIFFAVEAALITTAIVYDNKGDDQTAQFEAFADDHWSVVKYSNYLIDHKDELGLPGDCSISINPDESLKPWERIENWDELNHCESRFSHRLERHGEQQYYELIGKYGQYSSGWDEFNSATDGFYDVPQIMKDYAQMRGDANSSYNVSEKAVIGLFVNHLLSAIDAVWSAANYNSDLAVKMRMENLYLADRLEWVPTLNIKYNF